jgi:hypothetical protein
MAFEKFIQRKTLLSLDFILTCERFVFYFFELRCLIPLQFKYIKVIVFDIKDYEFVFQRNIGVIG